MENVDKERRIRLTKWINSHLEDWEKVCGLKYTSIEELRRLIKALNEEGFFELVEMLTTRWYAQLSNKE